MTRLHQSLYAHRVAPAQRLWPSVIAVAMFAGVQAFVYLGGMFATFGRDGVAATAYGQPFFVWGSIATTVMLGALVAYDFRRHDAPMWRYARWLIVLMTGALLGALLVFLGRAAAQL